MGFVEMPRKSGLKSVGLVLAMAACFWILVIVVVNGPLAPALKATGEVVGRVKTRLGRAMADMIRAPTPVPTSITAENVTARPGEMFEIPCRLGLDAPPGPGSGQDLIGSYRLDVSVSDGNVWTSCASVWSRDGIATFHGVVDPDSPPVTKVFRIEFAGTEVWERSTTFVFLKIGR